MAWMRRIARDLQLTEMIVRAQRDPVYIPLMHVQRHVNHLESKPFRRKTRNGTWRHVEPCPIGGLCDRVVQVKEKLIGAAADGRHLTKRQSQTNGFREFNAFRADCLVLKQGNETTAARVRPYVIT